MLARIVVIAAVGLVACSPQTPEQEAEAFLRSVADCISDNRETVVESFGDEGAATPERWEDMCGLVQERGRAAFQEILPQFMRAAMAAAFSGADDEAMGEATVDLLAGAFSDAAEQVRSDSRAGS